MPYDELAAGGHHLILEERERLTVSGVEEVESFDENLIVMDTAQGVLVVRGEGLHIEKLSLDGGGDRGIPDLRGRTEKGRLPLPAAGVSGGGLHHGPGHGLSGGAGPGSRPGGAL